MSAQLTPIGSPAAPGPIEVQCDSLPADRPHVFSSAFRIGRATGCEVCIRDEYVSRTHAEVAPEPGGWRITDLHSSNGLYWRGTRVENVSITSSEVVRLGIEGPEISFQVRASTQLEGLSKLPAEDIEEYVKRYFREPVEGEVIGEHTRYIRSAFAHIQARQKEVYSRQKRVLRGTIGCLVIAGLAIGAYTYRLQREVRHQRELAHDLFYAMKSLDVEIAAAEQTALRADRKTGQEAVDKYEARRRQTQTEYDQFLTTLHIYDRNATEQHRLIMRVARIFGECELDMPPDFESEVLRYIKIWQSTGRFVRDVRTAEEKGYTRTIPEALLSRGLPAQFFYLAMQESDFDQWRSGPLTRKGYAKGMWQFIPETAVKYGLHLGPLVDENWKDTADEREQPDKATDAATRYIQTLYSSDAQASGLLVMACYNWGEEQILPLVRSMPLNPRERNFWRLLAGHRIPQETYDYVFYITSAAVIGENPRLFGFDFDNPLAGAR